MPVPVPTKMPEAFAIDAPNGVAPGNRTWPFPTATQVPTAPGRASLDTGFTTLNMTAKGSGGIPPSGTDLNGILYWLSQITAAVSAGQIFNVYDNTYAAAIGGYALGAMLQQAANASAVWISTANNNTSDPDTGGANWLSSVPLYSNTALTGVNNVALPGPSDYIIDVDTTSGPISYTGFVAQRDGQRITFTNVGATSNLLSFTALSGSSAGANQMRVPTPLSLVEYQSLTIQYSSGLGKWVAV